MISRRTGTIVLVVAGLAFLGAGLAYEIVATAPLRGALRVFTALVALGNRTDLPDNQRLELARSLCSERYLAHKPLSLSREGGIKGFPRAIDKNYRAWREGENVWICPTNPDYSNRPQRRALDLRI
ncbi:MAG: hypothetical protein ACP5XB_27495, partial [Isosphaeraceae bacterium]